MWIIFKLTVTIVAFFLRLRSRSFARRGLKTVNGSAYIIELKETKSSSINTNIGIDFNCPSIFKITKEGFWDRLFKFLSISEEVQTGDSEFDRKFYIASDAPAFKAAVKNDPRIREAIKNIFNHGCHHIYCDGVTLWILLPGDKRNNSSVIESCVALKEEFAEVKRLSSRTIHDPFAVKVMIIEAIIFSFAAYAWTGFIEWYHFREDVHLNPYFVVGFGLILGFLMTLVFTLAVIVILRKSSRSHRVIVESAIVMGLSFPIGGIQILSDVNTGLDNSRPVEVEAEVTGLSREEHEGRSRRRYSYHLDIYPESNMTEVEVPKHIRISRDKYEELLNAKAVTITIGKGYLELPWLKSIKVRGKDLSSRNQ